MPLRFDATLKDLARDAPRAYLTTFDAPPTDPVTLLNVDLSTVTTAADVIFGLGHPLREIVHIDFQASASAGKHADVLVYNALLYRQYRVPVHSIVILLRPQAAHPNLKGTLQYEARPGRGKMDFGYETIRLWERPAEDLLAGDLATVPLAPLGRLPAGASLEQGLARVIEQVLNRLLAEALPDRARHLLTAAYVLTGLRVERAIALRLFKGVQAMHESDTYLAILDEGRVDALHKTLLALGRIRFGAANTEVENAIKSIGDIDRLSRLTERLLVVSTWQELARDALTGRERKGPAMPDPLKLRILENDTLAYEVGLAGPLELGRQQAREPAAYALVAADATTPARLIVAHQDERDNVSRHHALLEPLPAGRVRVTNRSKAALACDAGAIAPGAAVELAAPFALALPGRTVSISAAGSADQAGLHSLDEQTIGPSRLADLSSRLRSLPALAASQLNEVAAWLQATMGVLHATVGAADFQEKATQALVEILGLEQGRVLRLEGDAWTVAATHGATPEGSKPWQASEQVLTRVRAQKRTFWQSGRQARDADTPSPEPLQSIVAAPILDAAGAVIGALYGERRKAGASPLHLSGKLEALLVELLACGVATGLARQAQEKAALEARVRFEQFFGPDLARQLARDPGLLEGRDARVTLLFCDVRGFSSFSEKLGSAQTVRWMNDLMGALSKCVLDEQGVLVDYIGDELMAMWGAPQDQPDQAARAVRAALAMRAALPAVNQRWQDVLKGAAEVGLGINTGAAQVGNTGSEYKFKYGPLGDTVNLASRVQGLTKYLKCRLLVTGATRALLGAEFIARRVVRARVVNIEKPVDLYEVAAAGSEQQRLFFTESEAALNALETGDFAFAARQVGTLLLDHRGDGPLLLILYRASRALMQDGRDFNVVWEPPGK